MSFAQSGSHGKIHTGQQQQQQQQQQGFDSKYPLYSEQYEILTLLDSCVLGHDRHLFTPLRQAYDSKWLVIPFIRKQKIWHEYRKLEKRFNEEFIPKSSPACAEKEAQALEKLKAKITYQQNK